MALPSSGATDWGNKLNTFLNAGHDSDGTHTKSQMLTDMEWSPTAAVSGTVSMTFPNGIVVKWGEYTCSGVGPYTVSFPTKFPNDCYQTVLSQSSDTNYSTNWVVEAVSDTDFTVHSGVNAYKFRWIAIGY